MLLVHLNLFISFLGWPKNFIYLIYALNYLSVQIANYLFLTLFFKSFVFLKQLNTEKSYHLKVIYPILL